MAIDVSFDDIDVNNKDKENLKKASEQLIENLKKLTEQIKAAEQNTVNAEAAEERLKAAHKIFIKLTNEPSPPLEINQIHQELAKAEKAANGLAVHLSPELTLVRQHRKAEQPPALQKAQKQQVRKTGTGAWAAQQAKRKQAAEEAARRAKEEAERLAAENKAKATQKPPPLPTRPPKPEQQPTTDQPSQHPDQPTDSSLSRGAKDAKEVIAEGTVKKRMEELQKKINEANNPPPPSTKIPPGKIPKAPLDPFKSTNTPPTNPSPENTKPQQPKSQTTVANATTNNPNFNFENIRTHFKDASDKGGVAGLDNYKNGIANYALLDRAKPQGGFKCDLVPELEGKKPIPMEISEAPDKQGFRVEFNMAAPPTTPNPNIVTEYDKFAERMMQLAVDDLESNPNGPSFNFDISCSTNSFKEQATKDALAKAIARYQTKGYFKTAETTPTVISSTLNAKITKSQLPGPAITPGFTQASSPPPPPSAPKSTSGGPPPPPPGGPPLGGSHLNKPPTTAEGGRTALLEQIRSKRKPSIS